MEESKQKTIQPFILRTQLNKNSKASKFINNINSKIIDKREVTSEEKITALNEFSLGAKYKDDQKGSSSGNVSYNSAYKARNYFEETLIVKEEEKKESPQKFILRLEKKSIQKNNIIFIKS